jgi:hypothetical protein
MERLEDNCPIADGPCSVIKDEIEDEKMEGNKQQDHLCQDIRVISQVLAQKAVFQL